MLVCWLPPHPPLTRNQVFWWIWSILPGSSHSAGLLWNLGGVHFWRSSSIWARSHSKGTPLYWSFLLFGGEGLFIYFFRNVNLEICDWKLSLLFVCWLLLSGTQCLLQEFTRQCFQCSSSQGHYRLHQTVQSQCRCIFAHHGKAS